MSRIQISSIALVENLVPETSFIRELRRADSFTRLAVAVSEQALKNLLSPEKKRDTAIVIGTARGPLDTNFAALDTLLDDGEGQMSPTLFSHSVFNTAAGYLSRLFQIRGPAYTMTNNCWPFLLALQEAKTALENGTTQRTLVLGVETSSRLLTEAGFDLKEGNFSALKTGAVAWVLEPQNRTANTPLCFINSLEFQEEAVNPEDLLSPHPLDHSLAASRRALSLKDSNVNKTVWTAEEPFGTARLELTGRHTSCR